MNKFLTVAVATTLLTSTAMAGERTITVPTPKSITIVCSDSVQPGTVVLTNPPKFSCKDYELASKMVGTGITVGPDTNLNRILSSLRRVNRRTARLARIRSEGRVKEIGNSNSWNDINEPSLDDFDKKFPGINRNRKFFVSDNNSCRGWVSVARILNGECSNSKIRTQENIFN
jgi:hypothetical protein